MQQLGEQGFDEDSQLSLSDVNKLLSGAYRPRAQVQDDLLHSFRVFDRNGNGFLEYDELYRALFQIGSEALEESARDDFDRLVRLVDKNQDGKIDYSEFCQMVTMGVAELRRQLDED
ncbi:hypothetical protein BOX15_Mlig001231g3 [Macrostomum lignano]|nr:hypothetical protein BOX15_Mlig001231g3 [Macrostomum lignano]